MCSSGVSSSKQHYSKRRNPSTFSLKEGKLESFLLFILLLLAPDPMQAGSNPPQQQNVNARPDPVVTTKAQPESPLTITAKPHWFDEKIFEIYVVVKNVADKPVTAYATTWSNLSVPNSHKACFIYSFPAPGKMLRRDKTDGKSHWNNTDEKNRPPQLEFAVDFVESSDGSTWGRDYCQAKEYLEGSRAGLRAARTLFKKIVAEAGSQRLIDDLDKGPVKIDTPPERSGRWVEAFRSGVERMRSSVLRAYQERGLPEIDIELSRPIDASENPEAKQ
jgi:hypothetical protein